MHAERGGRQQTKEGGLRGEQPRRHLHPGCAASRAVGTGIFPGSQPSSLMVHRGHRSGLIHMVPAELHLWFEIATRSARRIQDVGSRRP